MQHRHVRHQSIGNQWLHCSFCHRASVDGFYHLVNDKSDGPQPVKLCLEHFWILKQAGEKGRVHAQTGIRWWLAEHRQQSQAHATTDQNQP